MPLLEILKDIPTIAAAKRTEQRFVQSGKRTMPLPESSNGKLYKTGQRAIKILKS